MNTSEALEELALHCLKDTEVYKPRTGDDLMNAMIIFMDVFTPLVWDRSEILGLDMPQRELLMEELGSNLRQTIMLGTGIDPHNQSSGWTADLK